MAKKKQLDFDSYKGQFPGIEKIKEFGDKHKVLIHASNILKKAEDCINENASSSIQDKEILEYYQECR